MFSLLPSLILLSLGFGNVSAAYTCYGVSSENLGAVCSEHGSCVADNACECEIGYFGSNCNFTTSFMTLVYSVVYDEPVCPFLNVDDIEMLIIHDNNCRLNYEDYTEVCNIGELEYERTSFEGGLGCNPLNQTGEPEMDEFSICRNVANRTTGGYIYEDKICGDIFKNETSEILEVDIDYLNTIGFHMTVFEDPDCNPSPTGYWTKNWFKWNRCVLYDDGWSMYFAKYYCVGDSVTEFLFSDFVNCETFDFTTTWPNLESQPCNGLGKYIPYNFTCPYTNETEWEIVIDPPVEDAEDNATESTSSSFFSFIGGNFDLDVFFAPEYSCDLETTAPPSRAYGIGFTFPHYQSYIFGGYGVDSYMNKGNMNDVWRINSDNDCCFVSGDDYVNNTQNFYFSPMTFDPSNVISSRARVSGFSSSFSFFILFGSLYPLRETNEVWEFSVVGRVGETLHTWRIMHEEDLGADPSLHPSVRSGACSAKLDAHNAYFFGGEETLDEDAGITRKNNDVWRYDVMNNEFTRVYEGSVGANTSHMSDVVDEIQYGLLTPQEFGPAVEPYRRSDCICWVVVESSSLVVFGGTLLDRSSTNDVWMFNFTSNEWGYITGNNWDEWNQIETFHDFDPLNLPAVRSGPIYFTNQDEFGGSAEVFEHMMTFSERMFFGGFHSIKGTTWADVWSFSANLMQFKFVNGTQPLEDHGNRDIDDIGSRGFGVGLFKRNGEVLIFGGLSLNH